MSNKEATPAKGAALIIPNSDITTMTSLEIAELTGKEHSKVTADIERTLDEAGIDAAEFRVISKDSMNRDRTIYNLPRRECDLVVSGYFTKYRLAIIDRWHELEKAKPKQLSRMELIQLAMDAEIELQALSKQNQILIPKANALDRLSNASGAYSLRDTAKQLKMSPHALNKWLDSNGWCFKNGKSERVAYQCRIDSGLMVMKSGENCGHSFIQPMITTKGLAKLSIVFSGW